MTTKTIVYLVLSILLSATHFFLFVPKGGASSAELYGMLIGQFFASVVISGIIALIYYAVKRKFIGYESCALIILIAVALQFFGTLGGAA